MLSPFINISITSTRESSTFTSYLLITTRSVIHFYFFSKQGQEVGRQSHEIRMLCIEKEIEMARSLAVSVSRAFIFIPCPT